MSGLVLSGLSASPATIRVEKAGIAGDEPRAAAAGLAVLREGGNAIDAVTTTALAMAVTYPRAGNLGGGGFLIYRQARGAVLALDFRETAPSNASFDMYWGAGGEPVPEMSRVGALAVGVPGTVRGLYRIHRRFGLLPWKRVVEPAIRFAREGVVVDSNLSATLLLQENQFKQFPAAYRIFYPDGKVPLPGDTLRQPDLARTLEIIAREGDRGFYGGEIARRIVSAVRRRGGVFQIKDLQDYRAVEREPVRIRYRGYTIYSMPPPSSGGLVLQGILNTLQNFDLAGKFNRNGADYLALLSEIEKQWYAKRNLYLGDPEFVPVPESLFSGRTQARKVAGSIHLDRPAPAGSLAEYSRLRPPESRETTHLSVVDEAGNAVALTYTLNGSFGSYLMAEGTGILLNNEMDDFAAKPGYPNLYGLVQGWTNAVRPGKRMLSSMTPTIVEKDGELEGVLGTPGGSQIITTVLQVLLNKIDFNLSLKKAVAEGRFHDQWLPDSISYEPDRIDSVVIGQLQRRGFQFVKTAKIGDIQAIWRDGNAWEVTSDPRGPGKPAGY